MSEPLFSVVCPVYNCEPYLDDLVHAILNHANDAQIEWLFVHDCSTDQSEQRLRAGLAACADRLRSPVVHLVHEKNGGLAAARNTGIRAARGSYIGFVDSDDLPLPGYGEKILAALRQYQPQVLEVGYREFIEARTLLQELVETSTAPEVCKLEAGDHYRLLFNHNFFAWTRIVRRDFFQRVMFTEDRLAYEDIPYGMALFCEVDGVHFLDQALIGYRKRPGSITAIRDRRFLDQYTQLKKAIQIYRQHPSAQRRKSFEWRLLRKLVIVLLKGVRINSSDGRQHFFKSIYEDLKDPQNPFRQPVTGVGRMLAGLLAFSVSAGR